ncbi:MAG TPA: hypothetical protein VN461_19255 [Vicinamibacteria bacterium]|nr:hypothetical protein [Vicinamibacteria bacterium]
MNEEQERLAQRLRRVREEVRERALLERDPGSVLPPALLPRSPEPRPDASAPPAEAAPPPPDPAAVNALWRAEPPDAPRSLWSRLAARLLRPRLEAQVAFNARQVQLDNEILAYLDARFAATHRHYDAVLGLTGRHLTDIDERHLILQEELVAHVHDLIRRIDLVLAEVERGRVSGESALRDVRARLRLLEERLPRG